MLQFFKYIYSSKFLIIILPTVVFVGLFVFLKFLFILFSDSHRLNISTPSEKIVSSIRNFAQNDSTKNKFTEDSTLGKDNFYKKKYNHIEEHEIKDKQKAEK